MKALLFLPFIIISQFSFSQITINPSQANRGQTLTTTITPPGSHMTVSSGIGGMYEFILKKGAYEISDVGYTYPYTGLGFTTYFSVDFNIPFSAPPGVYDVIINNQLTWPGSWIQNGIFQILESHLQGTVFFDFNQNGFRDSLEYGVANQKVKINQTVLLTDAEGDYRSDFHFGNIHDSLILAPNFILTTPYSSYYLHIPPDTIGNDFGVYTPPDSVMVHNFMTVADPIRCNRLSKAYWTVSSVSHNFQHGTLTIIMDTTLSYVTSSMNPSTVSGDTIRWNYSLQPFQSLNTSVTFLGGPPNTATGFIAIDSLFDSVGNFVSAESDTIREMIRCSFDPNSKSVMPIGVDSMYHYTLNSEELTYTIRFQNCGTDTAFIVTVVDDLNTNLDPSSIRLLYTSHSCIKSIDSNGKIQFIFDNILLPDSTTDEINSHGMIVFAIRLKPGVPDHTFINNRALIYFDYNPPVATNYVYNIIVSQIPTVEINTIRDDATRVYPNPVTCISYFNISTKEELQLSIYDVVGNLVCIKLVNENAFLSAESFKTGIYFYTLKDDNEEIKFKGKFVVVR